jgi:hypothetical protein
MQIIQLYEWEFPRRKFDTMYGRITHGEWIKKEKVRIEKGEGRVAEIRHRGSEVTLFVDKRGFLK